MSVAEITCRHCGAAGLEDETDLCPRLCPACFEAALRRITARVRTRRTRGASAQEGQAYLLAALRGLGVIDGALHAVAAAISGVA